MVRTRINGLAVYDFMARNNLSQKEWAERVGISQCYASQLVCGTRCPSPRLRRRMLLVMNPLEFGELFAVLKGECVEAGRGPANGNLAPAPPQADDTEEGGRMNTPTLTSAIARQRWDVVAHLLVYGLIVVQTNGNGATPPGGRSAMTPAPAAKLPAGHGGV